MKIRILGTNHRIAPVELREKLALAEPMQAEALAQLGRIRGVREAVLLSTCNRFELITVEDGVCGAEVGSLIGEWAGLPFDRLEDSFRRLDDEEAIRHLFRVASSLDSMILGESQINGQVKEAYRVAAAAGTLGPILHRLFHKAFAVAKRVRTETGVGSATLSVAHAAVDMVQAVFDDLSRHPILLLGAGEMAELALKSFQSKGARRVWVSNRTLERATDVAVPLGAGVVPWEERVTFLSEVDVVLCSTGGQHPVLTKEDVQTVRKTRRGRPLVLVDISVPRNLDPCIHELPGVYQFDIDDLADAVHDNKQSRAREAEAAQLLIDEEVEVFARVLSLVHVSPLLKSIHQKVARDARREIERTQQNLRDVLESIDEDARRRVVQALERMAGALSKRFLHHPLDRLKVLGELGERDRLVEAAELFGVEATLLMVRDSETETPSSGQLTVVPRRKDA